MQGKVKICIPFYLFLSDAMEKISFQIKTSLRIRVGFLFLRRIADVMYYVKSIIKLFLIVNVASSKLLI